MNKYYTKVVLYAYASLDAVMEQIDNLVEKKTLGSFSDYSPALKQCEQVAELFWQKDVIIYLKEITEKVLKKYTEKELLYFDYKYFKQKEKECFIGFDYTSRAYFRKQNALVKSFSEKIERAGINDEYFEEYVLKIGFFKEMLKRVYELEKNCFKNKPKALKKDVKKDDKKLTAYRTQTQTKVANAG